MFMVLQYGGQFEGEARWGIPYREPFAGPFRTSDDAQAEIDEYFARWPEDSTNFRIFECVPVPTL